MIIFFGYFYTFISIVTFQAVCKTDEGHSCVFPFKYKGVVHEKCTLSQSSKAWCAYDIEVGTEVPVDGFHWGDCTSSCPVEGVKV